jgi:acyl-CoA thioesterase FadM
MIKDENIWGVTVELTLKYKKPVPLNEELRVVGRIIKDQAGYLKVPVRYY